MTPSRPGCSCASASCSLLNWICSGLLSNDTSMDTSANSSLVSGVKRGSRKAADKAFSCTSSINGRNASRLPMQPRRPSCRYSVTKVAPGSSSQSTRGRSCDLKPNSLPIAARARCTSIFPLLVSNMIILLGKGDRRVTHHPVALAGGVAGVAQVEQVRFACGEDQATDRGATAGMFVIYGLVKFDYVVGGLAVGVLGGSVGHVMR